MVRSYSFTKVQAGGRGEEGGGGRRAEVGGREGGAGREGGRVRGLGFQRAPPMTRSYSFHKVGVLGA